MAIVSKKEGNIKDAKKKAQASFLEIVFLKLPNAV
jgi:hypothetical protein